MRRAGDLLLFWMDNMREYFLFVFYFPADRNESFYDIDRIMFHIPFLTPLFLSDCKTVCENDCICEIILNEKQK